VESLRVWLRRLEQRGDEGLINIPQQDGTVARFRPQELEEALERNTAIVRAHLLGKELPPPHPLALAAQNSSDPRWRESFFSEAVIVKGAEKEDLSEA
jgi:hypothetical protein